MAGLSRDDVRQLERAAARAWPAARIVDVDGWSVRLSGGGARRANSVLPLVFTGRNVDTAIDRVEALYAAAGTRAYFQVSSIAEPADLDQRLAARGYVYEEPCLLMAKSLAAVPFPAGVVVSDAPSAAWLSIYTEPLDAVRKVAAPAVLATVPAPRAFLLYVRDGEPVSSALAVVSPEGALLVECVATRSAARRAGAGRIIMDAVESWAEAHGARTAALQVVATNQPATTLYARRGYDVVGRYHYRWSDV